MFPLKTVRMMVLATAASAAAFLPTASFASVNIAIGVSVGTPPPALPVYAQPPIPAPGYIWTPGYWAWGPAGYYWVPGVWVMPPAVGMLWTPGYWGWGGSAYVFHAGYWGPHIGFYGGVNVTSASRTAVDYANSFYAPSYTIFGAGVGYEAPKKDWKVSLDLKNLANEKYVTAVAPQYDAKGKDVAALYPGDGIGAYVGLELRY